MPISQFEWFTDCYSEQESPEVRSASARFVALYLDFHLEISTV